MNPYAAFDALQIIASLQSIYRNVAEAEVHLFAYLSCLLSLYSGQPVGDWGYDFAGTTTGSAVDPGATRNCIRVRAS